MTQRRRTKRRILSAGAGMVAITAVEGLACGNPVSPRYDNMPPDQQPTVVDPSQESNGDPNDMVMATDEPAAAADDAGAAVVPDGPLESETNAP